MLQNKSILLVEDDRIDAMAVKRALRDLNITNPLIHRQDGEDALAYLRSAEELPAIILLDLNMPKMNGLEFLKVAKTENRFRCIPTVVLTTSKEDQDRVDSYDLGVAGYMIKPVDYQQFVEVIRTIHMYWTLSELPT